jgi:regulator of protease activity HflC (stomatin/prohibitin superfamily)
MTSIDLREQFIDLPPQPVITRDNVTINVDSVVYWMITDPIKSVYEINDLVGSLVQLTITGMRAVMGEMDLDHTLVVTRSDQFEAASDPRRSDRQMGREGDSRRCQKYQPPEDVRITMEKQMTAERNRRALILQAEGDKQAAITRAEGEKQAAVTRSEGNKQSAILDAEGAAQARLVAATAEAQAINQISQVIGNPEQTAQYLITARYIESLRDMTRTQNSKSDIHADGNLDNALEHRGDQRSIYRDRREAGAVAKHAAFSERIEQIDWRRTTNQPCTKSSH